MPIRIKRPRYEIPTTDEERSLLKLAGLGGHRYVAIEGDPGFRRIVGEFSDIATAKLQLTGPTVTFFGRTNEKRVWIQVFDRRLENPEGQQPKSKFKDESTGFSLPKIAQRCDVSIGTIHNWIRGVRVGGQVVRLHCNVIGTRCKVTEEQLAKFQADCRLAKFGDPAAPPPMTAAEFDAIGQRAREEALAACRA